VLAAPLVRNEPAGAVRLLDTDPGPAWLQALGESTVPAGFTTDRGGDYLKAGRKVLFMHHAG